MNNLYTKQTEEGLLRLLAAQKQAYTEGKRINVLIYMVGLLSAIAIPIVTKYFPDFNISIAIVGGLFSVFVAFVLGDLPKKKAEVGAKIQEEFDTELYDLSWNESLAGNKVSQHEVQKLANRLKDRSNVSKDRPWYQDYSKLDHSHAVLHCQQENLFWDSTQKTRFSVFILATAGLLLILGWVWGFEVMGLNHKGYLVQVFFPMSGFLIFAYKTNRSNFEMTLRQAEHAAEARLQSEAYNKSEAEIPSEFLRKLQDSLFNMRKNGFLIPDIFYKMIQKRQEKIHKDTADQINQ